MYAGRSDRGALIQQRDICSCLRRGCRGGESADPHRSTTRMSRRTPRRFRAVGSNGIDLCPRPRTIADQPFRRTAPVTQARCPIAEGRSIRHSSGRRPSRNAGHAARPTECGRNARIPAAGQGRSDQFHRPEASIGRSSNWIVDGGACAGRCLERRASWREACPYRLGPRQPLAKERLVRCDGRRR